MAKESSTAQTEFFELIKEKLSNPGSLADAIAQGLYVSTDSAYRRLRGETSLTLEEALKLAHHFQISLDALAHVAPGLLLFRRTVIGTDPGGMKRYLEKTLKIFESVSSCKAIEAICSAKDLPVYYFFSFPELARFRIFQWQQITKNEMTAASKSFIPAKIGDDDYKIAKMIAREYAKIPFTELWNNETLNSVLRQILHLHHMRLFGEKHLSLLLCEQLEKVVDMIEEQTHTGVRWYEGRPLHPEVKHQLYYNNIILFDNSYSIKTDRYMLSMVSYNSVDYLITFNVAFGGDLAKFLYVQRNKSTLITEASEQQRMKFFKNMHAKIVTVKQQLKS